MAEALGIVTGVATILELSAKAADLCLKYFRAVSKAQSDIRRLGDGLRGLSIAIEGAGRLLAGSHATTLTTSRRLLDLTDECKSELTELQKRLDLGTSPRQMRHVGCRALKWPFESQEVDNIIRNLDRYKQTISLGLQIDQM
jgi:hypothetical protein